MTVREQALWTRARLGPGGPPLDLLTARFDQHVYAPHAMRSSPSACASAGPRSSTAAAAASARPRAPLMIEVAADAPLSPSVVVVTRCALGAALLLPFALRGGGLIRTVRTHWLPMLAFACIEIVGPWFTLTDAERHLSSSTAGLLIAGVPIAGVLLARFFGHTERLGLRL